MANAQEKKDRKATRGGVLCSEVRWSGRASLRGWPLSRAGKDERTELRGDAVGDAPGTAPCAKALRQEQV